jgi:hypothetical protein
MKNSINIAHALLCWAHEYRDGPIQWLGFPKTSVFHADHGLGSPKSHSDGKTLGDRAQDAYMAMLNGEGFQKFAHVLAIRVFKPHWIYEDKRKGLLKVGIRTPTNRADFDLVFDAWYQHALWVFAYALLNENNLPQNTCIGISNVHNAAIVPESTGETDLEQKQALA